MQERVSAVLVLAFGKYYTCTCTHVHGYVDWYEPHSCTCTYMYVKHNIQVYVDVCTQTYTCTQYYPKMGDETMYMYSESMEGHALQYLWFIEPCLVYINNS